METEKKMTKQSNSGFNVNVVVDVVLVVVAV